ncbi:DUF6600 domain-containing protein [Trinickia fusca]|uniref:FecR protein n=1 Tax=Trinickia fusca TaxID=2419777 RepID=A0A494XSX9_9BURK|nr:DUF6600 domain-containing protein [Trinickia fusca]RKP52761.1 FecR protein [Trinickia fusca]
MKIPTTSPLVTFRRLTGYALIALAAQTAFTQSALAQSAPPPDAPAATQSADPPSRVARLDYMAGTVTTEPAGASDWSYAAVNRPLTTGDQLWNDANARSELHIGSTAVRLGASTNLDILNLDDTSAQMKVAQGTLSTRVRALPQGSSYEIDTPNVALAVTRAGDYRVDVAPDGSTTTVTVRSGALTAYGDNGQVPLTAGQQITFSGTNLQEAASQEVPPLDAFDQWAASRDAAEDRSVSARYVSRDIPGYQDLDENGTWRNDPQYGAVWVPHYEPEGWAPYHDGHWAWVAPWGWTWIDDAPWGFAPYHYGRWAYVGSSWCWVPGPLVVSAPPVYAPALVAFVGGGGGGVNWGVSLSIGGAAAAGVAWFPLGPGEIWRPHWGGWSPRYYERVNQTVIVNQNINITNIHNTYINYHAPGALTAVPATAFVHGQPVPRFAQKVDPRAWHDVKINEGAPGIAPVRESFAPGLKAATYRPPQALTARPVVATRAPAVPAAFHDHLAQRFAQSGGQVPGAGEPVVHMTAPTGVAGQPGQPPRGIGAAPAMPMHNVRVVDQHSPVITPQHGPALTGTPRPQTGGPGAPVTAEGMHPGMGMHPGTAPGQAQPHAPVMAPQQANGVPRPPSAQPHVEDAAVPARHEPTWTQPHAPMSQQHLPEMAPQHAPTAPGAAEPGREAQQATHLPQPTERAPQAAQAQPHPAPAPTFEQRQTRAEPQPHVPMQPRSEPRAQTQPQAQYEPRPAAPQPQPHVEPRNEPRPAMEAPRPVMQPHPAPQARPEPQPHSEPQPRAEPHQQQQTHGQPSASTDSREEHHHG